MSGNEKRYRTGAPNLYPHHMDAPWNGGTPKSFILVGVSIINESF